MKRKKYSEKTNHYLYKISNILTNEYYVGVRSCSCEIEKDHYMGSSQNWTKEYIKENKDNLKKEILNCFESREIADKEEVLLLKSCQGDELCKNILYDKIPSWLGKHQSEEHINKRKLFGERNGMYGKKHTEETKEKMAKASREKVFTDEHRQKIGLAHKGKVVSEETRKKLAKSKSIDFYIEDIETNEIVKMSLTEYAKLKNFPSSSGLSYARDNGTIYKKRYKIYTIEAFESNLNRTLGELLETPEVDNQQPSLGSI